MAADPLEQVLRLVADGTLTAEEAAPILAALDATDTAQAAARDAHATAAAIRDGARRLAEENAQSARQDATAAAIDPPAGQASGDGPRKPATSLRIEVSDGGHNVVNLRLPLAVGRFALDRVPGLSGDQVARVREAMNSGFRGPVLVVDDDGDGVRISIE
jgi:hypothetical protein